MHAFIDLPAAVHAPAAARRMVGAALFAWGFSDLGDDAALIVSELVANAYDHAPGSASFELELIRRDNGVSIRLADHSAIMPIVRELVGPETRGRGMRIVAALATDWGAEPHHDGKRVWVDLDRPGSE